MMLSLLLALAMPAADDAAGFGRCVVDGNRAGATALLAAKPGSRESRDMAKKWIAKGSACGKGLGKTKLDETGVRGAVAAAMYVQAFAAAPAALTGDPAPFQGSNDASLFKYDIARCAATRDPVGADMLVRADAGSAEEKAGFARVIPAVGRCTPTGAKLGFGKVELKALTAEGLLALRNAGTVN